MRLNTTQAIKALGILSRKLEETAKAEAAIGLAKSSELATNEKAFVDQFQEGAIELLTKKDPDELPERHRKTLRTALGLYCKNARAAGGTVSALGREKWADELREEAQQIETEVFPLLDDQRSLSIK